MQVNRGQRFNTRGSPDQHDHARSLRIAPRRPDAGVWRRTRDSLRNLLSQANPPFDEEDLIEEYDDPEPEVFGHGGIYDGCCIGRLFRYDHYSEEIDTFAISGPDMLFTPLENGWHHGGDRLKILWDGTIEILDYEEFWYGSAVQQSSWGNLKYFNRWVLLEEMEKAFSKCGLDFGYWERKNIPVIQIEDIDTIYDYDA